MTPLWFLGWCVAVAFGGGFAVASLGLATAFAVQLIGGELAAVRRKR